MLTGALPVAACIAGLVYSVGTLGRKKDKTLPGQAF